MYNNLNSIILEGNLTRTPNLAHTGKGTSVCNFSIASNRFFKSDEETIQEVSYIDVEAWAKLGEICAEKLDKGRGVRVVGRIKQDRWEDDEGKLHSRHKIVAEHVEFQPQRKQKNSEVPKSEAITDSFTKIEASQKQFAEKEMALF